MAAPRSKPPALVPNEAQPVFDSLSKAALADLVWSLLRLHRDGDWLLALTEAIAPIIELRGDRRPRGMYPGGRHSAAPAASPPRVNSPLPPVVAPLPSIPAPRPRAVMGVQAPMGGVDEEVL